METNELLGTIPDIFLVDKIKEGDCERSIKGIIKRHSPLCMKIIRRYTPAMVVTNSFSPEMYKEMNVLIYQSVISFNPDKKVKFSTWLGNQTRYFCLNILNKSSKRIRLLMVDCKDVDVIAYNDVEPSSLIDSGDVRDYIFNILDQMKDERIKKVFKIRYFSCNRKLAPWEKIAKDLDVSTQTVINLHNRGKEILKKKLSSRNMDRMDKI